MNILPVELLHQIFISLPSQDRIKCTSVCRAWYNTLNQRSLLRDVDISERRYSKFKDMLALFPHRAAQVEELRLTSCADPEFDKRTLLNMFPNLRNLTLRGEKTDLPEIDHISKPFQFMHSTSKLESITDIGECELTCQLAISNVCQHLTRLDLEFKSSSPDSYDRVIPQLKNMPALECLTLSDCPVELTLLEILHNNLPSITELNIDSSFIASSEVPRDVEPATPVTTLSFQLDFAPDNSRIHVEFYKYLAKKYPSTTDFCCFDSELRDQTLHYAIDVFDDGICPFLERVGPQLSGFTFEHYCDDIGTFERLDDIGCQFKELTINSYHDDEYLFEDLARSDQAKSIKILELNDIVPDPAELLINMQVLNSLIIDCGSSSSDDDVDNRELDLNQLLRACPSTLTYLSTDYVGVKCIGPRASFTPITYLSLSQVELTPALAKTIETSIPNLKTLDLSGLITSDITISLPTHHLARAYITTYHKKGRRNAFSIKTMNNGRIEYHAFKPTQVKDMFGVSKMEERIRPVSKEEVSEPLMLNFTCASAFTTMVSSWEES